MSVELDPTRPQTRLKSVTRGGTELVPNPKRPVSKRDNHPFPYMLEGPNAPMSVRFANIFRGADPVLGQDPSPSRMHWEDRPVVPEVAWAVRVARSARRHQEAVNHRREDQHAMRQVLQAVGVESPFQVRDALRDPKRRAEIQADLHRKIASQYSVYEPDQKVKESKRAKEVAEYGRMANGFITDYLRFGVLNPIAYKINMSNEVIAANDPIDLIELMFDPNKSAKIRFEAKRKLFLMRQFAAQDYRARELEEGNKFQAFQKFLDQHVLDRNRPTGDTVTATLLSRHAAEDYRTLSVEEVPTRQVEKARANVLTHQPDADGYNLRLTTLGQRHFKHNGFLVPVFIDPRDKNEHSRVEKQLRKGEEDPAIAVEDMMGMIVVLKDDQAIDLFLEHLQEAADESGSMISFEGFEDSLHSGTYTAQNTGSSPETRMLKFFARVHGMRIEIIMHTYDSYLDYHFSDKTGHREYKIRRLFSSGLFDLLFPQVIYKTVQPKEDEEQMLLERRVEKRNSRIG